MPKDGQSPIERIDEQRGAARPRKRATGTRFVAAAAAVASERHGDEGESVDQERRQVLPGRSAIELASPLVWAYAVFVALTTGLLPMLFLLPVGRQRGLFGSPILIAYATLWIAGAAVVVAFQVVFAIRVFREQRAGYTTVNGRHRRVDQVEPRTGIVILKGGERALTPKELRERTAQARDCFVVSGGGD